MHKSQRVRLLAAIGATATAGAAFFAAATAVPAGGASKEPPIDRQAIAKALLAHHSRYLSAQAQRELAHVAGLDKPGNSLADESEGGGVAPNASTAVPIQGSKAPRLKLKNVRVNNPAADRYQVDQTTQSETALAVSGNEDRGRLQRLPAHPPLLHGRHRSDRVRVLHRRGQVLRRRRRRPQPARLHQRRRSLAGLRPRRSLLLLDAHGERDHGQRRGRRRPFEQRRQELDGPAHRVAEQ